MRRYRLPDLHLRAGVSNSLTEIELLDSGLNGFGLGLVIPVERKKGTKKVSKFIIGAQHLIGALGQLANMKRGCRTQPLSRVIYATDLKNNRPPFVANGNS